MIEVRVQEEPFDLGADAARLSAARTDVGAVVTFTGLVRGGACEAMLLEHYPGMTEKALERIAFQAAERWPLQGLILVHRYGRLLPGEPIVLVAAAAAHRQDAFDAAQFLMDWLKTRAPFWKREETKAGAHWVDAKAADDEAAARWI